MRPSAALLLAVALLAAPAAARADGDPASDVLIGQDVFYPYPPNEAGDGVRRALDGMVAKAKARGYPVKVALIAARGDLGAYPNLLNQPDKYAALLATEISFNTTPRVLVVLPGGLAGRNLGPRAVGALRGLRPPDGSGGEGAARTAMIALGRLTTAAGHPVAVPAIARDTVVAPAKGGGGDPPALLIYGLPVALLVAAAAIAGRRGRARDAQGDQDR
jgi:hypothetical protein